MATSNSNSDTVTTRNTCVIKPSSDSSSSPKKSNSTTESPQQVLKTSCPGSELQSSLSASPSGKKENDSGLNRQGDQSNPPSRTDSRENDSAEGPANTGISTQLVRDFPLLRAPRIQHLKNQWISACVILVMIPTGLSPWLSVRREGEKRSSKIAQTTFECVLGRRKEERRQGLYAYPRTCTCTLITVQALVHVGIR